MATIHQVIELADKASSRNAKLRALDLANFVAQEHGIPRFELRNHGSEQLLEFSQRGYDSLLEEMGEPPEPKSLCQAGSTSQEDDHTRFG